MRANKVTVAPTTNSDCWNFLTDGRRARLPRRGTADALSRLATKPATNETDARFVGERFSCGSPVRLSDALARIAAVRGARAACGLHVARGCALSRQKNPWKAVNDPQVVARETAMQIQRALLADLLRHLRQELDRRCDMQGASKASVQWRILRADPAPHGRLGPASRGNGRRETRQVMRVALRHT